METWYQITQLSSNTLYYNLCTDIIIITAIIINIFYTLECILRAIIENLAAEISFAAHSVQLFFTTYKSSGLKYHFLPAIKILMIISPWRTLNCLYFPIAKNKKTLQWWNYSEAKRWRCYFLSITHDAMSYVCTIIWY